MARKDGGDGREFLGMVGNGAIHGSGRMQGGGVDGRIGRGRGGEPARRHTRAHSVGTPSTTGGHIVGWGGRGG